MSEPTVLAWQQRKRQEEIEYGTFRASGPIYVDGTLAYVKGHAVPISNVRKFGYDKQGLVERVDRQPLDAPLPGDYVPDEPPPAGEGWNDSPDGALDEAPDAPSTPQGQTIEIDGQPEQ